MKRRRLDLPQYGLVTHSAAVFPPCRVTGDVAQWELRALCHKRGGPWEWWQGMTFVPTTLPLRILICPPSHCYALQLGTTVGVGRDSWVDVEVQLVWLVEQGMQDHARNIYSKWDHAVVFRRPNNLFDYGDTGV